jgi:hypothetical protein
MVLRENAVAPAERHSLLAADRDNAALAKQMSPTREPETVNRSRTGNRSTALGARSVFFIAVPLLPTIHNSQFTMHSFFLSSFDTDDLL